MAEGKYWPGWYEGPSSSDDDSLFPPIPEGMSPGELQCEMIRRGNLYKIKKAERRERRERERIEREEMIVEKYHSDMEEEAEFCGASDGDQSFQLPKRAKKQNAKAGAKRQRVPNTNKRQRRTGPSRSAKAVRPGSKRKVNLGAMKQELQTRNSSTVVAQPRRTILHTEMPVFSSSSDSDSDVLLSALACRKKGTTPTPCQSSGTEENEFE